MTEAAPGQVWRHYKNGACVVVLHLGRDDETGAHLVIYRAWDGGEVMVAHHGAFDVFFTFTGQRVWPLGDYGLEPEDAAGERVTTPPAPTGAPPRTPA